MEKNNPLICAVDPGNTQSAYVLYDGTIFLDMGILQNRDLLYMMRLPHFDILAVEHVHSMGMKIGQTVIDTCMWYGRFIEAFVEATKDDEEKRYTLIPRREIKYNLCNSMKATDTNIKQALTDRFEPDLQPKKRPKGKLKGVVKDIWSAVAVAVTWYDTFNRHGMEGVANLNNTGA